MAVRETLSSLEELYDYQRVKVYPTLENTTIFRAVII